MTNPELLTACDTLAAEFLRQRNAIDVQRNVLTTMESELNEKVGDLAKIRALVESNSIAIETIAPKRERRYVDTHGLMRRLGKVDAA